MQAKSALRSILCRIEVGLRILAKLLLLLPILLGMVWFNFKVDRSGLFKEEEFTQTLATALIAGENLPNYESMDERALLADYAAEVETPPQTLALGSSRILQLSEVAVGTSFFNGGMTGADFYDVLGSYYLFDREDKLPENLIISLDAWLFNTSEEAYSPFSNEALYLEFCATRLGIQNGWVPAEEASPEKTRHYEALIDPSYFQGSLSYYLRTRNDPPVPETEAVAAPTVQGDLYSQRTEVKMADGSVLYTPTFRNAQQEEINARARAEAGTFGVMHGYDHADEELVGIFTRFIEYVQDSGVNVIFVLVPYHPAVYNYATELSGHFTGFFEAEAFFADFAVAHNIPLYGSYNPFVMDCAESDFYDGLHITAEALSRVLPDMATIRIEQASSRPGSAWVWGETRVSYETAERIVAERYEIEAPQILLQAEDELIHSQECYVLERMVSEAAGATRLALYAVTQDKGIIYRYATDIGEWVVDARY